MISGILLALNMANAVLTDEVRPTAVPFGARQPATLGGVAYYVDAGNGRDGNSGFSRGSAWKSLRRVNRAEFGPGDRVFFAGGQTFEGTLRLRGGGSAAAPVLISSFGQVRATISAGTGAGIDLNACACVIVRRLRVVGAGRKNESDGAGIKLDRTRGIVLDDLDVSGFRLAGVFTSGDRDTRITRVYAHGNGFAGIATESGHNGTPRSHNLYIGDCRADNNPGDPKNLTNHSGNGIVVGGADNALIEYCEASGNGWDMPRDGNGPVGIWGWNCDRLTIQHCISHDNKSPGLDGGGFDFDGGVTNSVMQYNLSFNNMGCGYLLCQYPGARKWKDNIVRYNISVNDGSRNLKSGIGLWIGGEGFSDAQVYNNTIVNPNHAITSLGDVPGMVYRNNIFAGGGDVLNGPFSHSKFQYNLYWSKIGGALVRDEKTLYKTLEDWARATGQETIDGKCVGIYADPQLSQPISGQLMPADPRKLAALAHFRLGPRSPGLYAGVVIPKNGGRDLYGNPVPISKPPSLGAHQFGPEVLAPPPLAPHPQQ